MVQPESNQNNNIEEPKIINNKETSVTNPFYSGDKNPFDNTLGESNILPQIKNPNPNNLESSQQQNNDFNNVDSFANVNEVNTIIPKKEENIINESEINIDPFAGKTKIDTIIQSEINQNNNESKNNNINISPLVSNNPLYIEANNQNQNLISNINKDSNISSQENNNNINNVENQFQNMSIGNSQNLFGNTTESIINNSQKSNEINNSINNNQSNKNMAFDDEEEKINFASKIESFNTSQNQQQIIIIIKMFK